jgi:stress-induced morphogen
MPITEESLRAKLKAHFPDAAIEVTDLAGDDDHWQVRIISGAFAGKARIQQHRMVQDAVKDENIHALSIKTGTP